MTLKCECGKQLDDYRGARGHFQFTEGEVNGTDHGPDGEVPDGYKDLITDDGDEDADDGDDEPEPDDEGEASTGGGNRSASGTDDESEGGLKRLLTTPLDELLGGGGS